MSKEKIEEMAKIACVGFREGDCENCKSVGICSSYTISEKLYNAGYRKQSEVVRCKDCEHFYQDGNIKLCRHWNCHSTEDNAYCSFAKMKGGAE
jgi:hypothetical protein